MMIEADEKEPAQLGRTLAEQFGGHLAGGSSGLMSAALRASASSSFKGLLAERVKMTHSTTAAQFGGHLAGGSSGLMSAALRASASSSFKGLLAERVKMTHSTTAAQFGGHLAGVGPYPTDTFGLARLAEQFAGTGAWPYAATLGGPHQVDEFADDFGLSAVADFAGLARQPNAAPEVFAAVAAASCLSFLVGVWLHEAAALGVPLHLAYFTLICGIDFIQKATRATYRHALKLAQDLQQ